MKYNKTPPKEYKDFIANSPTLQKYKNTIIQCMMLYYPTTNPSDIEAAVDYSIHKRLKNSDKVRIVNSYKRYRDENDKYKDLEQQITLKKLSDYILSREPILTANGVMFKNHTTEPNPIDEVIQSFLSLRSKYKKQMFEYPKGSEDFEKYNLLQSLTKMSRDHLSVTMSEKPL